MFQCREHELSILNKRYDAGAFECVVIYGRRRVGKTALINEFCKNKPTIYFSALNSTATENLKILSTAVHSYLNPESVESPQYDDFSKVLSEITRLGRNQRLVLVIDEFPYLARAYPSISSQLQHIIDHQWSNSKLYLILCGSSMSFMEYQVLGYESPLYGRRTAQLKIQPLTYRETAQFNPQLTYEENALVYGVTGGVPHYINKLAIANSSIKDALLDNIFDTSSYLYEEPGNLLKQELREPGMYNSIITAIASGSSKLNEIVTKTGLDSSLCTKYIKVLCDLGIVRKEIPLTEKASKKTIYIIADCFFRFWYRFVPTNYGAINSRRIYQIYDRAIQPKLHEYMGNIFEKMCQDYLMYYAEDLPIDLNEIGQWWGTDATSHKQVQIDIVGTSASDGEHDNYIIGSCKFRNQSIGIDELKLLQYYSHVFGKGTTYYYYIFSLGGFTAELQKAADMGQVTLVGLDQMY